VDIAAVAVEETVAAVVLAGTKTFHFKKPRRKLRGFFFPRFRRGLGEVCP